MILPALMIYTLVLVYPETYEFNKNCQQPLSLFIICNYLQLQLSIQN
jgi:hypothetical protein